MTPILPADRLRELMDENGITTRGAKVHIDMFIKAIQALATDALVAEPESIEAYPFGVEYRNYIRERIAQLTTVPDRGKK